MYVCFVLIKYQSINSWWTESRTESAELRVQFGLHADIISYWGQFFARPRCRVHKTRLIPRMSRRRQNATAQSPSRRGIHFVASSHFATISTRFIMPRHQTGEH